MTQPAIDAPLQTGERFHIHTAPLHLIDRIVDVYKPAVFIETGTYLGFTIERVKHLFQHVYTIELGLHLWQNAKAKFANDANVVVIHGDSGQALPAVLAAIGDQRALVWLDAHWSRGVTARGEIDTAVSAELDAIRDAGRRDHVLMVDDLADFTGVNGYPTVDALVQRIYEINPAYTIKQLPLRRGVLLALP